jgi:nucleoid DNA-binding protein
MAKPLTKSEILVRLAKRTELSRKQVAAVLEDLSGLIAAAMYKKGGTGIFVLPGLLKITVVEKPATPERRGINPFTKQEQVFKAKPARRVVKVRPLKKLKDMAK